jgi:hypothetical protein
VTTYEPSRQLPARRPRQPAAMMDEGDEFALLYRRSDVAPNDYFPKEADKNSVGPKRSERLPRRKDRRDTNATLGLQNSKAPGTFSTQVGIPRGVRRGSTQSMLPRGVPTQSMLADDVNSSASQSNPAAVTAIDSHQTFPLF